MPSLRDLRRATADRVAPFELAHTGLAQGAGYAGVAIASNRRRIVSSELASVDVLGLGPENPGDYLKNEWAYLLADPPEQRRIPAGGFVGYARADEVAAGQDPALAPPETPVAYLDVERPFPWVVPAGLEVEIHAIPPLRGGKSAGLHAHVNRALKVILREDTLAVPGVSGSTTLDVTSTFPWLTMPAQFSSAHAVQMQAGVETWAIPGASLRFDADRALLTVPGGVSTGQTFPVRVMRPLSTWIKPALSSVWMESSVGLVDEDDQCLGDADAISLVAAFHAAEAEAHASVIGTPAQTYWLTRASQFASRSVFLRDQRPRRSPSAGYEWPDYTSVDGRYGGKFGAGWR